MASSANTFQQITLCNNEGVRLMLQDDLDKAMECFKHGITLIRSKLAEEEQQPQQDQDMTCEYKTLHGQKVIGSISLIKHPSEFYDSDINHAKRSLPARVTPLDFDVLKPQPTMFKDANDGFISFFHRVLIISDRAISEISEMGDPCSLLSSVILFNIALNHHRKGLQSASHSYRLSKALSLYSVISSILEKSQDQTISTKFGLLIYLACCNNMAHIYSEMCAFNELRNTWRNLFDLCVAYHHVIDYVLDPEEQDLFLLNAFLFTEGANIAPAA